MTNALATRAASPLYRGCSSVKLLSALALAVCCPACRPREQTTPPTAATADAPAHGEKSPHHIDVSDSVRRNLGITFARVESRAVEHTIRMPGRFEVQPYARRQYHAMLSGRIELLVKQYDTVAAGDSLYRLASPEWRELQLKLNDAMSGIRQTEARLASIGPLLNAHKHHETLLSDSVSLWETRAKQVEQSANSGALSIDERTSILNTLAGKRADLAEVMEREAELEAQGVTAKAEHDAAHARFQLLLATAATLLGISEKELVAPYELDQHLHTIPNADIRHDDSVVPPDALWRTIREIDVKAGIPGIVDTIAINTGGWASAGGGILTTLDQKQLRFRAMGMQSDIGRLHAGLPARIVPPKGGFIALSDVMEASLALGLDVQPDTRMMELIAVPRALSDWARPGVAAYLEITTAGGSTALAIPLSCVVQDGPLKYLFRRNQSNPDEVHRIAADLGANDGRWVVVESGVREGDEVVLDGAYQLMLSTSGSAPAGGHFHADGSFHGEEGK